MLPKFIWIVENHREGRYIGGGRDKSAPTIVEVILFICFIVPLKCAFYSAISPLTADKYASSSLGTVS